VRGSPKDAEFYATQAIDLARDLSSDRMIARATASRVEVRILIGNSNGADIDLKSIEELIRAVRLILTFLRFEDVLTLCTPCRLLVLKPWNYED